MALFDSQNLNSWNNSVIFRAASLEDVIEVIRSIPAKPDVRYLARNEKTNEYECVLVTGYKNQAVRLIAKLKGK